MIGAILMLADEVVEVRVNGNDVYFKNSGYGNNWAPIEGLRLSYEGVCKEFPELNGDPNWQTETIIRFKEKIRSFSSEKRKIDYIIEDLRKHGYKPVALQREGFRRERIS